ncbi:Non-essential glycogen phosphorylase [Mucor velutinosus]|uniref:Non-essential glycogen phosphorylase n=1 Tax=Mucor velutinosus TaxID=708070 RepID=A0AAN7I1G1_9FUNG|nr:Non-essential glycogen phosphorylase [Mucor velutinosus]
MNHADAASYPPQATLDSNVDYFDHLQRYSALYRILLATPYSTNVISKQWYRINLKLVNELDLSLTGQQKSKCWLEVGCYLLVEKNKSIIPCKECLIQCRPLQHDAWDTTTASDIAGFQNDAVGDLEFMVSLQDEGYVSSSTASIKAKYYIQIYPKQQQPSSIMAFPLMIGPISIEEQTMQLASSQQPLLNDQWKQQNMSNTIYHGYRLQDSSFLIIQEDWSLGTPGKMWDSALVLSQMIADRIKHNPGYFQKRGLVDLSAGTGCLGLLIAALYKNIYKNYQHSMPHITLTDLPDALNLIYRNRAYNHLEGYTSVKSLEWGNYQDVQNLLLEGPLHTVIASDVLYRPSTFHSLVQTLSWLSDENKNQIEIYVGYKRRGLALCDEQKFFDLCAQRFDIITVSAMPAIGTATAIRQTKKSSIEGWIMNEDEPDAIYKDTGVNIYQLIRK